MPPPIVILAGGSDTLPHRPIPQGATVIAADSGLHLAAGLGIGVDVIVGDLDSADPAAVAAAQAEGALVERHEPDKDATDLDLALQAARRMGGSPVIVVGGDGGDRIDHLLAGSALLTAQRFADLDIEWWAGTSRAIVARGAVAIDAAAGDLVSIIPASPSVTVTTSGLRWPLAGERLEHGSTRGVSNEVTDGAASVTVSEGTAFVVHTERSAS
jgi:thiamine pyrophosphokinase